jgi:hypothetical protein
MHRVNGVPAGSVLDYRCDVCGHEVVLESGGRLLVTALASAWFLFMGSFFVVGMWEWLKDILAGDTALPNANSAFMGALFGAFLATGVYGVVKSSLRYHRAMRNPIA